MPWGFAIVAHECTAWCAGYGTSDDARKACRELVTGDKLLWVSSQGLWLEADPAADVSVPWHTIRYVVLREITVAPPAAFPHHMLAGRIVDK